MKLNDCGQTMVEYTLMIVVIISIMTSMFRQLEGYLVDNPDSLQNSYLNNFKENFQGNNASFSGQYSQYRIPR